MLRKLPLRFVACVFAFGMAGLTPDEFAAADTADLGWASRIIRAAGGNDQPTIFAFAHDFIGTSPSARPGRYTDLIANDGTGIETAGSGSRWLYDPVHHIAASSDGGDVTGDVLAYAAPPRGHVKMRDLSRIVSPRGLRLDLTSEEVVRILGVTPRAVKRLSATRSELYLRTNVKCAPYMCAHDEVFEFTRDRAVSIFLADLGP